MPENRFYNTIYISVLAAKFLLFLDVEIHMFSKITNPWYFNFAITKLNQNYEKVIFLTKE